MWAAKGARRKTSPLVAAEKVITRTHTHTHMHERKVSRAPARPVIKTHTHQHAAKRQYPGLAHGAVVSGVAQLLV